jgi:hypothetical protein
MSKKRIVNRHVKPVIPQAGAQPLTFRHNLPVRMARMQDGRLMLYHTAIRISDLTKAPRVLGNLVIGWIKHLVNRASEMIAVRALAGWWRAALAVRTSVTDWNALPPFANGKPAAYMALTDAGHMQIPQKRIMVIEKHIVHDPRGGREALLKAYDAL